MEQTVIGAYGPWAAEIVGEQPGALSFRNPAWTDNEEDQLFTLPEMKRADRILREVFEKAGVGDQYRCSFHPGPHKFDRPMQAEAFDWFDRWLRDA